MMLTLFNLHNDTRICSEREVTQHKVQNNTDTLEVFSIDILYFIF